MQHRDEAGQVKVYGKGGRTRVVLLPSRLWLVVTQLRGDAGLVRRCSGPQRVVRSIRCRCIGLSKLRPPALVFLLRFRRIGCAMLMRRTSSIGPHRSIWSRPPWVTLALPRPAGICMRDRMTAARGIWRSDPSVFR